MAHEFRRRRRVEFAETDMAGIMHFSHYFRFMEETEHAFFRELGVTLHSHEDGEMRGFVRVHAACDYHRPLHYGDEVEIRLLVRRKDTSSIDYGFDFHRVGDQDARPVARGALRVVHVGRRHDEGRMRRVRLPAEVDRLVEAGPAHEPPGHRGDGTNDGER